jgi:ABC-2 type transport system ATP-binding protein
MSMILRARDLQKTFRYQKRGQGWRSWFSPEYVTVEAVKALNLDIEAGERVAFVGPNGAGKSTSIKMFSGILTPTHGDIEVCGFVPHEQRRSLSYKIGCVFGQRSQLLPNLPLGDSFELFGRMYDMDMDAIRKQSDHLTEIFALHGFINQPVRQLSLGQRMRGEIAACLMHNPEIIFMDEPTIGLDVVAKRQLRDMLNYLNAEYKTTIFLTSHDTGDIESLSDRLVVIDHGQIIVDGQTSAMRGLNLDRKHIKVTYDVIHNPAILQEMGFDLHDTVVEGSVAVADGGLNHAIARLLEAGVVTDIQFEEQDLEDIIIDIYANSKSANLKGHKDD